MAVHGSEFLHLNSIGRDAITSAEECKKANLPKTVPLIEKKSENQPK
jgi:hypothetical protein